jgi:hypothetical protein
VWMHHLAGVLRISKHPLRFGDVIGKAPEVLAGTSA